MRMTTDGIVIATTNIDECDRLVTLLSAEIGVVRAYVRGAKRPGSKLSGSTELLGYSRFVLFKHKDRFTIDSADSNALFFGVRQDLTKLSLAAYLCELCADTAPAGEPAKEQQRLLLNCLHLLETGKRSAEFIKPLYELRQISLSGYMPDLVACRECGQYERPLFHFYPVSGELVCAGCDTAPKAGQYVELSPSVLAAMRHILYASPEKLYSFTLSQQALLQLTAVCERYVKTQLSRSFKTLDFYNAMLPN